MFITAILTLSYFREFTLRKSLSGVYRVVFRNGIGVNSGRIETWEAIWCGFHQKSIVLLRV